MEHEQPHHIPTSHASRTQNAHPSHSSFLKPYDNVLTSLHPALPPLLSSLTRHTALRTLLRLTTSILASHILRILFPTLLFYHPHALADMKLARSSPHYYLLTSVTEDFSWPGFCIWSLYAMGLKKARAMCWEGMTRDDLGDGWCVLYLVLGILSLEGAYVQTCWTGAQLYAYYTLFRGGKAEHEFLERFLEECNWRVMALLGLLVEWIVHGVVREVRDVVAGRRWAAGVGYAAVTMGTLYAVRYSNKYFVLLEMVDVWVMGVWFAVALGVVGMQGFRKRELEERGEAPKEE